MNDTVERLEGKPHSNKRGKRMLTTREAAERLGIKVDSVSDAANRGLMTGARKVDGLWVIPEQAVEHYRTHHLGNIGRGKGQKSSPVRRVVELRLKRVGRVNASGLADELDVTRALIAHYMRELGAKFDRSTNTWRPATTN